MCVSAHSTVGPELLLLLLQVLVHGHEALQLLHNAVDVTR